MTTEFRRERKLSEAEEDYLTCGRCQCEFPLQRITTFIEHKKQECDGPVADVQSKSRESGLQCVSCPMAFMTAVGMLKHVQFSHNLRLFLEKGAFSKGIQATSFPNSLTPLSTSTSAQNQLPLEKRKSPNRNNVSEQLTTSHTSSAASSTVSQSTVSQSTVSSSTESQSTVSQSTVSPSFPQDKKSTCPPAVQTQEHDQPNPLKLSLSDITKAGQSVTNTWNSSPTKSVYNSPKRPATQSPKLSGNKALHSALTRPPNSGMNQSQKSVFVQSKSGSINQSQKSTSSPTHLTGTNQAHKSMSLQTPSLAMNQAQNSSSPQTQSLAMNQAQNSTSAQTQSLAMNQAQNSTSQQTQSLTINQVQKPPSLQTLKACMNPLQKSTSPKKQSLNQSQILTSQLTQSTGMNQSQKSTSPQTLSHSSVPVSSQRNDSRQNATKQPILFPVTSQSSATLPKINIPVHLLNSDGSTPSDTSVLVGQDVGVGKVVPIVLLSGQMVEMAAKGCTPTQCSQVPSITSQCVASSQGTQIPSVTSQSVVSSTDKLSISPQANLSTQVPNPSTPVSSVSKQKPQLQAVNKLHSDNIPDKMEVSSDTSHEKQSLSDERRDSLATGESVEDDTFMVGGPLIVSLTDPIESVNSDVIMASLSTDPAPQLPADGKTAVHQVHDHGCSINTSQQPKNDIVATAQTSNRTVMDSCSQTEKSLKRVPEGIQNSSEEACCGRQCCGVTVIPGTHENTRKCCSSVLPKKRKRHMETKHMSYSWSRYNRRRLYSGLDKARSGGTIYIDVEDVRDDPPRSQVRTGCQEDSRTQVAGDKESCVNNVSSSMTSRGSVILQPGATFSIPIPYNTVSSGNRPRTSIIPIPGAQKKLPSMLPHPTDSKSHSPVQAKDSKSPPALSENTDQSVSFSETLGMSNIDTGSEIGLDPNYAFYQGRKRRYPTSRPFKCDQCDNAFNQRIHLKKHMSKHTGIKPYKCQQCDYSTVERSHLKVHIRIHTGEKPFKCTYCEYATAQNSTLKIHLKRHHGSQLLECPTCAKSFTQHDMYQVHQQEHQGDDLTDSSLGQAPDPNSESIRGEEGQGHLQSGLINVHPKEEVPDPSDTETTTREQAEC